MEELNVLFKSLSDLIAHLLAGYKATNGGRTIYLDDSLRPMVETATGGQPVDLHSISLGEYHPMFYDFNSTEAVLEYLNKGNTVVTPHGFTVVVTEDGRQVVEGRSGGKTKPYSFRYYYCYRKLHREPYEFALQAMEQLKIWRPV
jgi:hypothetical protein